MKDKNKMDEKNYKVIVEACKLHGCFVIALNISEKIIIQDFIYYINQLDIPISIFLDTMPIKQEDE